MKRLSPADAAFLYGESRATPMHVGGLHLYRPPEGESAEDFVRAMHAELVATSAFRKPFDQKLVWPRLGLGLPGWVDDPDFDIDYHIRHSALPEPGRYRELFVLASRLHGSLLDRTRPLWETHLIEGLESGQFALYTKIHHAVVDGVAAMRLLQSSLTEDPDDRSQPHMFAARPMRERARREPDRHSLYAAAEHLQNSLGVIPGITRSLSAMARAARAGGDSAMGLPYRAPRSPLNVCISGARRVVAQSYPLDRIKAVGRAFDTTVNDVVLAMSAGALRRYLGEIGGLPEQPLTAMTPVSVRPADGGELGNAVSAVICNLGTELADPADRMRAIHASMAEGKALLKGMTYHQIMGYTIFVLGPLIAPALFDVKQMLRPVFNVVVSNVPGPRRPLYWHGAKLEGMYPMSIVIHGMAVNITVTSYVDSLDFGITACRRSVPSVQRLIDYLEDALAELENAAGRP